MSDIAEVEGDEELSLRESMKKIFSWPNYRVYLLTAWGFNAVFVLGNYLTLYLRALNWDFLLLGSVMTIVASVAAISRFVGGYLGDVVDRRNLAVAAMLLASLHYLMIGISTEFSFIFGGLLFYALLNLPKGGSSAYIMDNIPKEDSGLGLSLFTMGRSLGIITLITFSITLPVLGFLETLRSLYFWAGVSLLFCTMIRALYLKSVQIEISSKSGSVARKFIRDNVEAIKTIIRVIPGVLLIVAIDALSDSFFNFGALIYTNEILGVSVDGITIMLAFSLAIVVPLLLKVGRISDQRGTKRAGILVYAMMPVCASLLLIGQVYLYWAPIEYVVAADSVYPGLGVIFSTPFVAVILKQVNDTLWWLVLLTLIQKKLPRKDTSKILACFWTSVYIMSSIGPLIAGAVFQFFEPYMLFLVIFGINLIILALIALGGLNSTSGPDMERPEST